jgi:hypothetical protein
MGWGHKTRRSETDSCDSRLSKSKTTVRVYGALLYHLARKLEASWDAGMLECWNAGMLECWNAGMLECWNAGG